MIQALSKSAKQFCTAILLLVTLAVLSELWLRVDGARAVKTVTPQAAGTAQSMLAPSTTTHHEMRRLSAFQLADNVVIRTNSLGLRGTLPTERKADDVTRVLVLGDETILGSVLSDEETVPSRLGNFLDRTGQKFEVINGGVPGFSPLLSWLQFRHELQQLQPNVVILHFDMSDVADDEFYRPLLQSDGFDQVCCNSLLSQSSGAANRIADLMHDSALCGWLKCRTGLRAKSNVGNSQKLRQQYEWAASNRADLRLAIKHALEPIEQFSTAAYDTGFELIVTTSPVPWQVTDSEEFPSLSKTIATNSAWPLTDDLPTKILATMCARLSVTFCDSTRSFREYSQPDKLFLPDDHKLSRYGAALYAREIAATVLSPKFTKTSSHQSTIQ